MGLGFLRLNRILAKHHWRRRDPGGDVEHERKREERSFNTWLIGIALVIVLLILLELMRVSRLGFP